MDYPETHGPEEREAANAAHWANEPDYDQLANEADERNDDPEHWEDAR